MILALVLALLLLILAYLCGSLCSAIVVSRLFALPDPCTAGSKNPGATNVLRLAGKKYAIIVLFFDILKGFIPVFVARLVGAGPTLLGLIAFAAVLGHVFPLFFHFRGGKGVATALGALFGLNLIAGLVAIAIWIGIAYCTKYSSLASIITMVLAPLYTSMIFGRLSLLPPLVLITLLILFKHKDNIMRLMERKEAKIRF